MTDQTPPPVSPYAGVTPMSPSDEKTWATLDHVLGIFFGWLSALVVYLVVKDRGPFVRAHAATALNFHLTMLIGYAIGFVLVFLVIGILVFIAIPILQIVFGIMAALAANNGQYYRYPIAIAFVH